MAVPVAAAAPPAQADAPSTALSIVEKAQRDAAFDRLLANALPHDESDALKVLGKFIRFGVRNSRDASVIALAKKLQGLYGKHGRLPLPCYKTWIMLDPTAFEADLAQFLQEIGAGIFEAQNNRSFFHLEAAEIATIEYLFETLNPLRHAELLSQVMHYKVLSDRRVGLLRRVVYRTRQAQAAAKDDRGIAIAHVGGAAALLDRILDDRGVYKPVADAASHARDEISRLERTLGVSE